MHEAYAPRELLISGAGGSAREVAQWVDNATWAGHGFRLLGFIDEPSAGGFVDGWPRMSVAEAVRAHAGAYFVAAVGEPGLRERLVQEGVGAGFVESPPLVHPDVRIDERHVSLGDGVIVCQGAVLTVNVRVGAHVQINVHTSVMHDTVIEDFSTLSPGTRINGGVVIESRVFMGSGAITVHGTVDQPLRIGTGAIIGAGSVVTADIPAGATAVGVPARVIKRGSGTGPPS